MDSLLFPQTRAMYGLQCFGLGILIGLGVRRGARYAALLGVMLFAAGSCSPQPVHAAEAPHEALGRILELRPPEMSKQFSCHGTPVGITQVLTAAHCVGPGTMRFVGQRRRDRIGPITGTLSLMWRDDKADLAMMSAEGGHPGWNIVPIGPEPPAVTEDVWWRLYVIRAVSSSARGQYHGLDSEGDMALSGPVTHGTSGSAVLNARGEMVGVMKMIYHPMLASSDPVMTITGALELLFHAARLQPMAAATPINRWPKP